MKTPKNRRPRLSWFRFYADDFLGGTGALTAPECGRYLLLLLHQWGTKERQVIPADAERLRVICRGEDPGGPVLEKFDPCDGGFRNQRLADEWHSAQNEYDRKSEGGGVQIPDRTPEQIPPKIPDRTRPPTKNQEPRTKNVLPPPSASASPAPPVSVEASVVQAPVSPLVKVPPSWSREACDDWADHLGTPPGQRVGGALKPLVRTHGWERVRPLWQEACESAANEPDPSYFTPEVFARTFKARLAAPRGRGKPTTQDKTAANLTAWIAAKEGA